MNVAAINGALGMCCKAIAIEEGEEYRGVVFRTRPHTETFASKIRPRINGRLKKAGLHKDLSRQKK